jgi:hypothetical protein
MAGLKRYLNNLSQPEQEVSIKISIIAEIITYDHYIFMDILAKITKITSD